MGPKLSADEKRQFAERLWNEYGPSIYRFALRLSGNRAVAEDIVGETILAALQAMRRLEPERIHRGYLFGIALNRWRRTRRAAPDPLEELVAAESPWRDSMIDLERAFRLLPRSLQEAFVLCKAEGMTSKEAAEILGIPQGTVQARTHEAILRLRQTLDADTPQPTLLREAQS